MKRTPLIAVLSFPGNNCEVESVRSIKEAGMDAIYFRWNDDVKKLKDVDGYFVPGGFSYEDRGRSGMVAARDPLMEFIAEEADAGKVVIGNCNGAQILVESGLIPLGKELAMSLAHNAVESGGRLVSPGFLSEWVWIKPACAPDRCATSNWQGPMHIPMAHGEGRFTTKDKDLLEELKKNDQIAFQYCDEEGNVSSDVAVTPNGSSMSIAGICNPAGNVVALMPHPERTVDAGLPYFVSVRQWIENGGGEAGKKMKKSSFKMPAIATHKTGLTEIFIGSLITNNEERTVEAALRRVAAKAALRQWKYLAVSESLVQGILNDLTVFNSNKERVYFRRGGAVTKWNAQSKREEAFEGSAAEAYFGVPLLLRRDEPDTGAAAYGDDAETGVCYGVSGVTEKKMTERAFREILSNPHSSTLSRLS